MKRTLPHLKTLKEIERECIPGLVEVLRWEGIEGVRYTLWDMTNWHRDYGPCVWRNRAMEEQKRVGWEMWVRMEKSLAVVLHEAHNWQVEETMGALSEGPESFYSTALTGRVRPFSGAYQYQQAAGLMALEELASKIKALEETRRLALAEMSGLEAQAARVSDLERDRDALCSNPGLR